MTIANFDEIRDAAVRVRDSMKHQGFLDVEVNTDRKVDDQKLTAEFFIDIDPGPQYKFGTLTVNGLGLDGEAAIRKMWSIEPGAPYPTDYPDYFVRKVKEDGIFDNLGDTKATPKINADTHVVDVTLDFKYGTATIKKAGANHSKRPGTTGPRLAVARADAERHHPRRQPVARRLRTHLA